MSNFGHPLKCPQNLLVHLHSPAYRRCVLEPGVAVRVWVELGFHVCRSSRQLCRPSPDLCRPGGRFLRLSLMLIESSGVWPSRHPSVPEQGWVPPSPLLPLPHLHPLKPSIWPAGGEKPNQQRLPWPHLVWHYKVIGLRENILQINYRSPRFANGPLAQGSASCFRMFPIILNTCNIKEHLEQNISHSPW